MKEFVKGVTIHQQDENHHDLQYKSNQFVNFKLIFNYLHIIEPSRIQEIIYITTHLVDPEDSQSLY